MIETIVTYVMEEKGITVATWALTVVTALDARVGVRIIARANVLIRVLAGRVRPAADEPEPQPQEQPTKTMNVGHFSR